MSKQTCYRAGLLASGSKRGLSGLPILGRTVARVMDKRLTSHSSATASELHRLPYSVRPLLANHPATYKKISSASICEYTHVCQITQRAITVNGLKPVINRVFPFEEAKAAYQFYQEAQPFGKVVISQN